MYFYCPSPGEVAAEIKLPVSKSMYNRWLIINHLSENPIMGQNIPEFDDGRVMAACLANFYTQQIFDVKESGTALRFLTALCAITEGERKITGTQHLMSRPMHDLISALQLLGAQITSTEENGKKFLHIIGGHLTGGNIEISAQVSSQFISALLLVAPMLQNGLKIQLLDRIASEPYITMTMMMMKQAGAKVLRKSSLISVKHQNYYAPPNLLENDWSAAAFWYEIAAFSSSCKIVLSGLSDNSCQGDAMVKDLFIKLGVNTTFNNGNALLQKNSINHSQIEVDFLNTPDLFPAMAVSCVGLGISFRFTGLNNLASKESNRIDAIMTELKKIGAHLIFDNVNSTLLFDGSRFMVAGEKVFFSTHYDHRIAMSLAPLCLLGIGVHLDYPECVSKSYPNYFNDLKSAGILIK